MIIFQQQETTEIRDRIGAACATFHKYRQELTSSCDKPNDELRLRNMYTLKRTQKND